MRRISYRVNGTIGGWCLRDKIPDRRCLGRNSVCLSETMTCGCTPGNVVCFFVSSVV